jgi:site-specific DNA-methyltransferase (adenine-specific)
MTLIQGDCIQKLIEITANSVDLVYLDPPFFSQREHSLRTRDNQTVYSFDDKWNSLSDYLVFIKQCLIECQRVLKPSGSIFLHCDKSASHHLRLLLDEVFGFDNFQSEIIWTYRRWSNAKKGLLNSHQNIYFYSKSADFQFNAIYTDYSLTTNLDQIWQERVRNENGKAVYKRDENGEVLNNREKKGVPLSDVWNIPFLNPKATERTGYPTQKPVLLLEQIIKLVTQENDLVVDPFCGSGTTLVAAKLLNRNYIGIDISSEAIKLSNERLNKLVKTRSWLLENGEENYLLKTEDELALLKTMKALPVQRNKGIDGFLQAHYKGGQVAVRIQKPNESLQVAKHKLITACQTKKCTLMILVRTNLIEELTFFEDNRDEENLIVLDSYDLIIDERLKSADYQLTKR